MTTRLKRDYTLFSKYRGSLDRVQGAERKPSSQPCSLKKASYPNKHPGLFYHSDQWTVDTSPANGLDSGCPTHFPLVPFIEFQSPAQRWVVSALLFCKHLTSIKYWPLALSGLRCPAYFMVLLEPIRRARLWYQESARCQRAHSWLGSFSETRIHPSNRNATRAFCGTLESIKMCCV